MRVRSPACTMFMLTSSPSPMFWLLRPRPFTVLGKSNAMRAGLATVKLPGCDLSASFSVSLTMTLPLCWDTLKASTLFGGVCANARTAQKDAVKTPIKPKILAIEILTFLLPLLPRLSAARSCAQSNRRMHPAPTL